MDKLQTYYGNAIRANVKPGKLSAEEQKSQIAVMQKAIMAVLYHTCELSDEKKRHKFCPEGVGSWCSYKRLTNRHDLLRALNVEEKRVFGDIVLLYINSSLPVGEIHFRLFMDVIPIKLCCLRLSNQPNFTERLVANWNRRGNAARERTRRSWGGSRRNKWATVPTMLSA